MILLTCHRSTVVNVSPFELALKEFRASLAPQEQSIFTQCHSADELIRHVENLGSLKRVHRRGKFIQRISQFSKSLSHYFDVIGILVQSHPEFAALAWGAFRLVLQVYVADRVLGQQLHSPLAAGEQF